MEFIFIFLLLAISGYTFLKYKKNITSKNFIKKEEIIASYENELKIQLQNTDDKIATKTNFIKKCNDELSRNIYFEKDEIKKALSQLSKL